MPNTDSLFSASSPIHSRILPWRDNTTTVVLQKLNTQTFLHNYIIVTSHIPTREVFPTFS